MLYFGNKMKLFNNKIAENKKKVVKLMKILKKMQVYIEIRIIFDYNAFCIYYIEYCG